MHVNAGQMDVVRRQLAQGHDFFDFGHANLAGHGHRRVEVARRQVEAQVAAGVGHGGFDQGHVGRQGALHHIGFAVELAQLLAVGH